MDCALVEVTCTRGLVGGWRSKGGPLLQTRTVRSYRVGDAEHCGEYVEDARQ
jgi:hypothetical protein